MRKSYLFLSFFVGLCIFVRNISAGCDEFRSGNWSRITIGVCAETSPDNSASSNGYTAYDPPAYSTVRCNIGDKIKFQFTVGKNAESNVFYGHCTRDIRDRVTNDFSTVQRYVLDDTKNNNGFRNMFAYPSDEEGLQLRNNQVSSKIGYQSGVNNLVTIEITVPEKGGEPGDDYDLNDKVLWIVFSTYSKTTPLYYCIDAAGLTEPTAMDYNGVLRVNNPIAVTQNPSELSIQFHDNTPSYITINSIDGKTVLQQSTMERKYSLPLSSLPASSYILNVVSGATEISRLLLVP